MAHDRIEAIAEAFPELSRILEELRGTGLREPEGPDPLLSPTLPAGVLDEFLNLAVRECGDENLFGLALVLPMCAFQRGAGYQALEHCLTSRNLPTDRRDFIAGRMLGAKSVADVVWAHGVVVATGNTGLYHSFLSRHAAVVVGKSFDQLARYLLDPGRGPGGYAASCVELVLQQDIGAPWPFVRRWLEWLDAGLFDGIAEPAAGSPAGGPPAGPAPERPAVLYRILEDNAARPAFAPLRDAAHRRVAELVATGQLTAAWHHLTAVIELGYGGADDVHREAAPVVARLDAGTYDAFAPAWSALLQLTTPRR